MSTHDHEPIRALVGERYRSLLAAVPGVHLTDHADPDGGPLVVDTEHVERALAHAARGIVILVSDEDDPAAGVRWIGQGADDVVAPGAGFAARLRVVVDRARARRQAQARRTHMLERFRTMVEHALDITTIIDATGVIEYESPSIERVLGYRPDELVGRNGLSLVHPLDLPRLRKLITDGRDDPTATATASYRFKAKNGEWRFLESRAVNRLHDPVIGGIVVVSRDVSDRYAAEARLREERTHLSALLEAIPDAYVLMDREGLLKRVHIPDDFPTVAPAADMIGRNVRDLLPEPVARSMLSAARRALRTGELVRFDYRLTVDGAEYHRDARVVRFTDEIALSVHWDSTDLVEAIRKQQVSESRFRLLFEESPDAVLVESADGLVLHANRAAGELHGADVAWLTGRHVSDLVPEMDRERVLEKLRRMAAGEASGGERRTRRRDGSVIPVEFRASRIVYDGQPALLVHLRDVSDRRAAERRIRELSSRMHLAVEEERRRIAREVHDVLGQDLTGLQLQLARLEKRIRPELQDAVSGMRSQVDDLISDVRRIASELRPSILDDLGLPAALAWQAERFESRTGISVSIHHDDEVPDVDPDRSITVFRVFQELLTNVARHANAGSVRVALGMSDDVLVLDVTDDGTGFDPAYDRGTPSLGILGMRERLSQWGGSLEYEPAAERGLTARVRVPLGEL